MCVFEKSKHSPPSGGTPTTITTLNTQTVYMWGPFTFFACWSCRPILSSGCIRTTNMYNNSLNTNNNISDTLLQPCRLSTELRMFSVWILTHWGAVDVRLYPPTEKHVCHIPPDLSGLIPDYNHLEVIFIVDNPNPCHIFMLLAEIFPSFVALIRISN